jgi:hypothetical protein
VIWPLKSSITKSAVEGRREELGVFLDLEGNRWDLLGPTRGLTESVFSKATASE